MGTPEITLDTLIRDNRDRLEIGLASDEETAPLVKDFEPVGVSQGRLKDWRLIAIRHLMSGETTIHLLGTRSLEGGWITSLVDAVSKDLSIAKTRNSIYELVDRGSGPPPTHTLLAVARALREWGLETKYGLACATVSEIVAAIDLDSEFV
jgi:hypothetical protein